MMSTVHERSKDAKKLGSATTNTDQTFKKEYQVVGQPETTDHDIHEDYLKSPPQNIPGGFPSETSQPLGKEGAYERETLQPGVLGQEGVGRPKHSDVEGELINENSIHPNR